MDGSAETGRFDGSDRILLLGCTGSRGTDTPDTGLTGSLLEIMQAGVFQGWTILGREAGRDGAVGTGRILDLPKDSRT